MLQLLLLLHGLNGDGARCGRNGSRRDELRLLEMMCMCRRR